MNLWDGKWYEKVVTEGYEYQPDGKEHDINFFPLYPAVVWLVMRIGISFAAAATLVSNFAFLAALYLLFQRTAEHYGVSAAGWAVAAMAWFPLSVFGSAAYTEAVFLLVTLAFLQAFEKHYYWLAALFAALVAICRVPGMALVAAAVVVAFLEKLPWRAYLPAVTSCLALGSFLAFQAFRFHDPIAFLHVQTHWEYLSLTDALHTFYRPNNLLRLLCWPGVVVLLWSVWRKLPRLDLLYAIFSLALILCAGRFGSDPRYMFGIASLFVAAGLWLSERPRFATAAVIISAAALSIESVAFAWDRFLG